MHVGYDFAQCYIYEDYIPLLDVKRIAKAALICPDDTDDDFA